MLYKVRWMQAYDFDDGRFTQEERYAVGGSCAEAISHAKQFIPDAYITKDFNAFTVNERMSGGELGLYKVRYKKQCQNGAAVKKKSILVPGHSEAEAVMYAMAHTDQDECSGYKAKRIDQVDGFTVTLS